MSKKKKSGLGNETVDSLLQQICMALFLNIFIVTSNHLSVYIGLFVAAATVFPPDLLPGDHR